MHTYSIGGKKENIRKTVVLCIFCLSIVICTLCNQLIEQLNTKFPEFFIGLNGFFVQWPWMGVPIYSISAFVVFGFLFWLFNNYFWKWGIIKMITTIPNFSGEWEGILKSSYNELSVYQIRIVIKQSWSRISILCYFSDSDSWSDTALINPEHGKGAMLKFTYSNRAKNISFAVKEHRGDNELFLGDYDKKSKRFTTLKGDYFNNRGNSGNVGYIELEFKG